jgi:hypothetical protein
VICGVERVVGEESSFGKNFEEKKCLENFYIKIIVIDGMDWRVAVID